MSRDKCESTKGSREWHTDWSIDPSKMLSAHFRRCWDGIWNTIRHCIFAQIVPGVTRCILSLISFPCNRVRVRVILPVSVPGTGVSWGLYSVSFQTSLLFPGANSSVISVVFIHKGTGLMFMDLGLTFLGLGLVVCWLCEDSLQLFLDGSLFHAKQGLGPSVFTVKFFVEFTDMTWSCKSKGKQYYFYKWTYEKTIFIT